MKLVFLITFLLVTAHCTPVREFHSGIHHDHFLNWKRIQRMRPCRLHRLYLQRFYELFNTCRKPPTNRRTTIVPMLPFSPITEITPSLTPNPTGSFTPDRRGDS
ncbi:endotoxic shock protective protein U9-ORF-like [Pseudorca crassidens]|uniref:endotoxic shock protective protein U9-ORF-like n=1 Tax=Pseudorca crassidens TaxID=82174 RepID=UPI00352DC2B3